VIGLDTNVLVRFIMRDDAAQTARADALIDGLGPGEGFVALLVLAELHWTLTRSYGLRSHQSAEAIAELLRAAEVRLEAPAVVRAALRLTHAGADFADAVIAGTAAEAGCTTTFTFDRRAARHPDMTLL